MARDLCDLASAAASIASPDRGHARVGVAFMASDSDVNTERAHSSVGSLGSFLPVARYASARASR